MPDDAWIALCCQSGDELLVACDLAKSGATVYVPMGRHLMRPHGRRSIHIEVQRPAFQNYVFAQVTSSLWQAVKGLKRKVSLVTVMHNDGTPCLIGGDVIEQVRRNERAGMFDTFGDHGRPMIAPGTMVGIMTGPLAGFVGEVIRTATDGRLVVNVSGYPVTLGLEVVDVATA